MSKKAAPKYLDELQDESYARSCLHGDAWVEFDAKVPALPAAFVPAARVPNGPGGERMVLNGTWRMKDSAPGYDSDVANGIGSPVESEGVLEGWYRPEHNRSAWYKVEVPTTVQAAMIKLGKLADPHWDDNTYREITEHGAPKDAEAWHFRKTRIEQRDWWFAKEFNLPKEWRGKQVRLHFEGIDYSGSFYLNGESLGHHEGMFGGPTRDVTHLLRPGRNTLVVRLDKVPDTWHGNMKGSPGWGWHYGHMISTGIWRDVVLETVESVQLEAPFVRTLSLEEKTAEVSIQYDLQCTDAQSGPVEVYAEIQGKTRKTKPLRFRMEHTPHFGLNRYEGKIGIPDPHPWWPVNYGDPDLYTLRLVAARGGGKEVLDTCETTFGIRTVEMEPLKGTRQKEDYRWQFVVNGVPMFIKGMNWCWPDPMLEVEEAKYEQIVELSRRAGVQMFRSWGGGIVESELFYQLCDAKGIMVYQEFSFCWGPPDFPWTNPAMLDQQVSHVVKARRNHPSLVMWGGGNENVKKSGNDEGLFLVGRRCRQFDPSRPFHRTSPWGGGFHNWRVFHGGLPIDEGFMINPSVWYGEFGCPSMPNWESNRRYLPLRKLKQWPPRLDDGGILMHMNQFSVGDMVKVMRYADYGPIDSWKRFIEYSQMAQGDELAFATRLQRAGSYDTKGGLWFYKMTELFPGQSWGVLDFYSVPKLSYYRAKQVFAPRSAWLFAEALDWKPGEHFKAELHVANDCGVPLEGAAVEVTLFGGDLAPFFQKTYQAGPLGVSARRRLARLNVALPKDRARPFIAAVRLRDKAGTVLNDEWHWFNFKNKTAAVKKMESHKSWNWPNEHVELWDEVWDAYAGLPETGLPYLPQTKLSAALRASAGGGSIRIANTGSLPAFNVVIDGFPHADGAFLDENSFFLYPGEERDVCYELPGGQKLDGVKVRAWNARAVRASGKG